MYNLLIKFLIGFCVISILFLIGFAIHVMFSEVGLLALIFTMIIAQLSYLIGELVYTSIK